MFGIGGWEFILIAGLALLLFGPDKLPQLARTAGRLMRDFKKYQALMESTIRGEILAAEPGLQKDPFETGKEFREKVGSGQFSRPSAKSEQSDDEAEAAADVETGPATNEDGDLLEPDPGDLIANSAMTGEIAIDEPDELPAEQPESIEEGEGEQSEA